MSTPANARTAAAGNAPGDAAIRDTLFALLDRRAAGATVCPSDVARALVAGADGWRALMPRIRQVAGRLAAAGRLRVTRGGVDVDATAAGGPIRLGRPPQPHPDDSPPDAAPQ